MSDLKTEGTQAVLAKRTMSPLAKYRKVVVGDTGFWRFVGYEVVTSLFGCWPGAVGLWLRQTFYPGLFRSCGKNVVFGVRLTLRHPHRIALADDVVIAEGCTLDAKGDDGDGIVIRAGVFLGQGTVVTMADGTIELDEGCNIGSYCRIGTFGRSRIGKKALLGAFCYVVGAYHETERTDIAILDQPNRTKGGAEVGDGCWLGARVTVMDGTHVGAHSIVGAHSVVTKDLPEYSVAMGIPAKVTKMRK